MYVMKWKPHTSKGRGTKSKASMHSRTGLLGVHLWHNEDPLSPYAAQQKQYHYQLGLSNKARGASMLVLVQWQPTLATHTIVVVGDLCRILRN